MSPAVAAAIEFLQLGESAATLDELDSLFARTVEAFGFNTFGLVELRAPGGPIRPRLLAGRTDADWDTHYGARQLHRVDPVVPHMLTATAPFTWTEAEHPQPTSEQQALFADARDAGAGEGLIVPIHGPLGETHLVKLTTPGPSIDPVVRTTLHALSVVYAARSRSLLAAESPPTVPPPSPLTRRETECLTLVAEGKSDWDIGRILKISPNTVHTLVERGKGKLGVRTRLQAVLLGMRKRWLIDLSPD